MPTVSVSETTFKRLAEKAAARNLTVDAMLAPILQRLAGDEPINGDLLLPSSRERQQAFKEWTMLVESRADRYPPGHVLDDDRESIYGEREMGQL
jgi:hypothetical protein